MCISFHHCITIIYSLTEPYTPYNVTVYALNENVKGEKTTKTNFTVEGGQFVVLHVTISITTCSVPEHSSIRLEYW